METYLIRNRNDKAISGCIGVKSVQELFDRIDQNHHPFDFEFCLTDPNSFWFDASTKWFVFKPMKNFYEEPQLIPV